MTYECGYWEVDSEVKKRDGHRYFVCKHRFNPTKVELVFVRFDGLHGRKDLVEFITKNRLNI